MSNTGFICLSYDVDTPIELAFRLWSYLISGWIRHPTDEIAKTSPAAGWKGLPQELVDEILGYSMDDLDALKACSLTCKHLFDSTRPLIHQRLCLVSGPARPKSEGSPSGRGQVDHGAFGRLVDADGSGLLRYTRHLTFKGPAGTFTIENRFSPRKMQEHLPRLRSITRLQRLTFDSIDVLPFFPVFDEYFGMFTNTVRQLDIRVIYGTGPQLLYFICQFPLLEDLTIISPSNAAPRPGDSVPVITRSPPLRGKLVLSNVYSGRLTDGLAVLPCGLNFHSLELHRCKPSQVFLTACGHTVTSVSYSWHTRNLQNFENCESNLFFRTDCDEPFGTSTRAGLRAKRGARKIRIHPPVVQSLATRRMGLRHTPNDNFSTVQRICNVDSEIALSTGFAIPDER